ncbi:UNVERIFIED_CONTAM: hypothetical protein NCL1_48721 [Trichonephila clavipes]
MIITPGFLHKFNLQDTTCLDNYVCEYINNLNLILNQFQWGKMSEISVETSSKRSLTVLAVVVACFAILWPKIFYPMIISILFPSDEEENQDEIRKLDFQDMLHPQMREAMGEARPLEKAIKDGNKF